MPVKSWILSVHQKQYTLLYQRENSSCSSRSMKNGGGSRGKRMCFYLLIHSKKRKEKEKQKLTTHEPFLKSRRLNQSLSKICISKAFPLPRVYLPSLFLVSHILAFPPYSCKHFALEERQNNVHSLWSNCFGVIDFTSLSVAPSWCLALLNQNPTSTLVSRSKWTNKYKISKESKRTET